MFSHGRIRETKDETFPWDKSQDRAVALEKERILRMRLPEEIATRSGAKGVFFQG